MGIVSSVMVDKGRAETFSLVHAYGDKDVTLMYRTIDTAVISGKRMLSQSTCQLRAY